MLLVAFNLVAFISGILMLTVEVDLLGFETWFQKKFVFYKLFLKQYKSNKLEEYGRP